MCFDFQCGVPSLSTSLHNSEKERSDDPNVVRGIAMAQWLANEHAAGVQTLEQAADDADRRFGSRYGNVERVFREEADLIHYDGELFHARTKPLDSYQLRATLSWETDANDLDLHAEAASASGSKQVYYAFKYDPSTGLRLYQDLTRGLGPEVITSARRNSAPIRFGAKLYRAGAFSVVRGVLVAAVFGGQSSRVPRVVPRIYPFTASADGRLQLLLELDTFSTDGYREGGGALKWC
jgi:hypothetical protein